MQESFLKIIWNFISDADILALIVAYLIAAVPCGLVLAKIFAHVKINEAGSHSIGATNVLRVVKEQNPVLAKQLAVATLISDALTGILPIVIAQILGFAPSVLWGMAVMAVIGHCYSPYLNFKGGKGIATGAGVLAIFIPLALLCALVVWGICAKVFKISSLASLLALITLLIASFIIYPNIEPIGSHAPILIIAFIIFNKHIPNIKRLILHQEKQV